MLLRNSSLNLLGLGAPLVAALFAIPPLVALLGESRFGLLTLLWAVVSYFGLFDLGIGRALTHDVSVLRGRSDDSAIAASIGTANLCLTVLGVLAGAVLYLAGPALIGRIDPAADPAEVRAALGALAVAMPFILLTAGLRGILEANLQFGWINALRAPYGIWTFVAPLAVAALAGPRLDLIAWVLAAGRIGFGLLHLLPVLKHSPSLLRQPTFSAAAAKRLLVTGGWLTVGNLVGPIMGYADRFLVGVFASASAVAYYATPQEIVTKLFIVPAAFTSVLFPAISSKIARGEADASALAHRALAMIAVVMLPVCTVGAVFSHWILSTWITPEFAAHSHQVLSILMIGTLLNALATVPFTALQSSGHSRVVAILYLVELPAFLALFAWLVPSMGVIGGALAWTLRNAADCLLLFALCRRHVWKPLRLHGAALQARP